MRVVVEVGIHLDDDLRSICDRPVEPGGVCRAETLLLVTAKQRDPGVLATETLGEISGSVRGVVIDHENSVALVSDCRDDMSQILSLVVCGDYNRDPVTRHSQRRAAFSCLPAGWFSSP